MAFKHQTLAGLKNLSLVPPSSSFLAASSKQALFIAFSASVSSDFVRILRSCPARGFLERTRIGG